jgi:hypothetical protein
MGIPAVSLPPSTLSTPAGELPLAVWPCAQTSAQYQRAGCYLPASTAHPAKMLPELARANLAHAHAAGATGSGRVVTGDARQLPDLLGRDLAGRVALVVTSPPYGSKRPA